MGWTQNTTSTDFIRTGYDYVTFANSFYYAYNGVNMYSYEDEELQKLNDRRNDMTEHPDRPWVRWLPTEIINTMAILTGMAISHNRVRPQMEHNLPSQGYREDQPLCQRIVTMTRMVFSGSRTKYRDYSFRAKVRRQVE